MVAALFVVNPNARGAHNKTNRAQYLKECDGVTMVLKKIWCVQRRISIQNETDERHVTFEIWRENDQQPGDDRLLISSLLVSL